LIVAKAALLQATERSAVNDDEEVAVSDSAALSDNPGATTPTAVCLYIYRLITKKNS